ncbi:hypothetical protein VaNZ11_002879 [Volvox africanus]|uniref:GRF-type domain-containing protein n=1 Tax=Volvox africanus TaxID=51714 RepID=A0ABQ5RSU1_9CHLO|nr:hypothetical protein VaNZ11_002879 [Volvox africanus]
MSQAAGAPIRNAFDVLMSRRHEISTSANKRSLGKSKPSKVQASLSTASSTTNTSRSSILTKRISLIPAEEAGSANPAAVMLQPLGPLDKKRVASEPPIRVGLRTSAEANARVKNQVSTDDLVEMPGTSGRTLPDEPQPKRPRLMATLRKSTTKTLSPQVHDLFLVLDLEATCTKRRDLFPIEIIEFSALLLDAHTLATLGEFQSYVRPTEYPRLDPFCVDLTGIQQEQVDTAPLLPVVLLRLKQWLEGLGALQEGRSLLPVTWTDWDLKVCLETECEWRKLERLPFLRRWCNLKRVYTNRYRRTNSLQKCVEAVGLRWHGRAHSGLDDSRNTAALMAKMVRDGCVLQVTDAFKDTAPVPGQAPSQIPAPALFPAAPPGAEGPERGHGGGTDPCDYFPISRSPCKEASGDADVSATQRGWADVVGSSPGSGTLRQTVLTLSSGPAAAAAAEVTLYDSAMRWLGKCKCGVPAHFRTTKKPGANLGRQFYSCGRWSISDRSKQCNFFAWADQLQMASGVAGRGPVR